MATERDWARGYLEQARADLRAAEVLQGAEPSVLAMLLQMVLEKIGKAALLRGGQLSIESAQRTHQAAARMVQLLKARQCQRLGFDYAFVSGSLAPLVHDLETSNPAVAKRLGRSGPWLEYPWEDSRGDLRWPARDLPGLERFGPKGGAGERLFMFASRLSRKFEEVFA